MYKKTFFSYHCKRKRLSQGLGEEARGIIGNFRITLLKFRLWFKYGLKGQKLLAQGGH